MDLAIKISEMKLKKLKIDTILTAALKPSDWDVIDQWAFASSRIFVHSQLKAPRQFDGLRVNPSKTERVRVVDALRSYVVQIPGKEVFAIAEPSVFISQDQAKLFAFVADQKMERTWAAFFAPNNPDIPDAFLMAAPVLPYILQEFPEGALFGTPEWRVWMHAWLGKFMLSHRYFNGSGFGFVTSATPPKPIDVPILDLPEPNGFVSDLTPQQEAPKPVKRKGRPKKVNPQSDVI